MVTLALLSPPPPPHPLVRQNFRYNELEMVYLVCSICVLLAGMTFQSGILNGGLALTVIVTYFVAVLLVGAMGTFVLLLTVEILRSIKAFNKAQLMSTKPAGTVTVNAAAALMQYSNSLFTARPPGQGPVRLPAQSPSSRRMTTYVSLAYSSARFCTAYLSLRLSTPQRVTPCFFTGRPSTAGMS